MDSTADPHGRDHRALPQTVAPPVASGFAPLADPAHQAMVKSLPVTLAMACDKHGPGLDDLLERLNAVVRNP